MTIDFDIDDMDEDDDVIDDAEESIDLEGKCVSSQRIDRDIIVPSSEAGNSESLPEEQEDYNSKTELTKNTEVNSEDQNF